MEIRLPETLELDKSNRSVFFVRQPQHTFTTPDSNDPHGVLTSPINDPEWWIHQFPKRSLSKFRYDAPHVRMIRKVLDTLHDPADQTQSHFRNAFPVIPIPDLIQIGQGRMGQSNLC